MDDFFFVLVCVSLAHEASARNCEWKNMEADEEPFLFTTGGCVALLSPAEQRAIGVSTRILG